MIVYSLLAESLIRYGLHCWGGTYNNTLQPLQVTQNYLLRVIFNKNRFFSASQLYSTYKLFDIRHLYIYCAALFIYKNKKYPILHTHGTRANINQDLTRPRFGKNVCQLFISYLGPKIYNKIPPDIRNLSNYYIFSKRTKTYVLENKKEFCEIF